MMSAGGSLFLEGRIFLLRGAEAVGREEVDMPLFFFIDKDIVDNPSARNVTDVVLSYTFFKYDLTLCIQQYCPHYFSQGSAK